MPSRRRYKNKRARSTPELDITTFLNLMVVLVPFLLISAVFSRITILELSVPTGGGPASGGQPEYTIEVIVRKAGLELSNGRSVVAALPKEGAESDYSYDKLSEMLMRLKADYPEKEDATVLMEPDIDYDTLIKVMDRVREVQLPPDSVAEVLAEEGTAPEEDAAPAEPKRLSLFPLISIGDAP